MFLGPSGLQMAMTLVSGLGVRCELHASKYPPRRPHSPKNPLLVEFMETTGIPDSAARTTSLKLVNSLPSAAPQATLPISLATSCKS